MRHGIRTALVAALLASLHPAASAQTHNVKLHVNPRWSQCSFQLDPALTQAAWRQFTGEAGVVAYFRPLTGAEPMGAGRFELSAMQWQTRVDDEDSAWNDTFVHPDSTHWLFESGGIQFPGFAFRAGLNPRTDVGVYFTKNPGANYGFYGAQLQRNVLNDREAGWSAAARASFISLYGPADLDFSIYGVDFVASRTYAVSRVILSPYAMVSSSLSRSHEKTVAVSLADENVFGVHGTFGAEARYGFAKLALEAAVSRVQSLSLKIGFGRF